MARALSLTIALFMLVAAALGPAHAQAPRVTVNGAGITDAQISARANLLRIEGRGASNNARIGMAREELIEETLMLQEAERLGISVSDSDVSNAYLTIARNMNLSADNLTQALNQSGVSTGTLRDRLRAGIAWAQVTQTAIASRVQIPDIELEQRAQQRITDAMSFDYVLREILFIGGGRSGEANRYRQSFQGCDSAVELSMNYRDAAVVDIGRRHATQLPAEVANELARLNVGGITSPRNVDRGVSMYAVCSKDVAVDTTFLRNEIRQEVGGELLRDEAATYLAELRQRANIVVN